MKEIAHGSCGVVFYMTVHLPCDWDKGYEKGVMEGLAARTDLGMGRVRNLGFT